MEALLLGLDVESPSNEELNAIFRAAHSIKGGAGTFGFGDIVEVTHVLENLLDKIRKRERQLTDEMVNVFLEAGDVINMQLAAHRGEGQVEPIEVKAVCDKLALLNGCSAVDISAELTPAPAAEKEDDSFGFFGEIPSQSAGTAEPGYGLFSEEVQPARTGEVESYGFYQKITPIIQQAAPAVAPLPESSASHVHVSEVDGVRGRRASDKEAATSEASSIRVNVEKVDQLINLVGELVITQAMLIQAASTMDGAIYERLQNGLHQLERNTRDLQEVVMSVRMLPISFVFSRYPRVVRDLAAKLNKQVELKTLGAGTELDKGLIEKLADPLTHLVRNSLDHGIETPEKRVAAGKPAKGTITLKASHQGGNVVIEVSDDGAGLNRARILNKAMERGLPVRDDMSDQDVWMLIFEAGFSTAEVVTDVSGRGVGMDVVKRNISALGGRIELDSVEGLGTRVIIRLPLTLAILDGLSVVVGSETYIIPLTYIVESLIIGANDLRSVSGAERLLHVRGEYLPLVVLRESFGLPAAPIKSDAIVVVVEAEGRKVALLVDDLLGQHQVVIKSLESNFRKLPGMSGATIMGDGKVAMILDVAALSLMPARHNQLAA